MIIILAQYLPLVNKKRVEINLLLVILSQFFIYLVYYRLIKEIRISFGNAFMSTTATYRSGGL